jgi:hypothetical protein
MKIRSEFEAGKATAPNFDEQEVPVASSMKSLPALVVGTPHTDEKL